MEEDLSSWSSTIDKVWTRDMGDVAARAPLPPLLAYTASKQKELSERKGKGKTFGRVKSGISNRNKAGISEVYNKNNTLHALPRPRSRKPEKKIEFDESARKEYLTGFQRRKQARIIKSKEKAKERERQEHKQLRVEAREARKKQAAENVAAEKLAYGDGQVDSGEEGEDDREEEMQAPAPPSAFDTEQHHTTVTVQEWDPNESESEQQEPAKSKAVKESLPPSSRRMAKKLKNNKELSGAREISKLMEVDEEQPLSVVRQIEDDEEENPHHWRGLMSISEQANAGPAKKPAKPKFHYESKLDRAKARSQARESKMKYAEKRREERNASGPKGRMQKNKGKRGHGNKGKKKP